MLVVFFIAAPLILIAIVWAGSNMLRNNGSTSSGSNAFGGFDVFDPGRERAEHDLESKKHTTVATPAAGDKDLPVFVDTDRNTVRIKRPSAD